MNDAERRRVFGPLRPMGASSPAEQNRAKSRLRLLVAIAGALVAAMLTGSGQWIGL